MAILSDIGAVAKAFSLVWTDVSALIQKVVKEYKIEKAIRDNVSFVDGLRKSKDTKSNDKPSA